MPKVSDYCRCESVRHFSSGGRMVSSEPSPAEQGRRGPSSAEFSAAPKGSVWVRPLPPVAAARTPPVPPGRGRRRRRLLRCKQTPLFSRIASQHELSKSSYVKSHYIGVVHSTHTGHRLVAW